MTHKFLVILKVLLSSLKALNSPIETPRTIWQPWTLAHTVQWESMEEADHERLYFRRNEYLENPEILELREKNWLRLHENLQENFSYVPPFPPPGYAILRKSDHHLIGSIMIKHATDPAYRQFGYGFIPEVRSQKYGQEIITRLLQLARESQGSPTLSFKDHGSRQNFFRQWYWQGKWHNPDWPHLLSYFSPQPFSFQGFQAEVDVDNAASLAAAQSKA